jgi:GNAT superfamily N-acetyltransferase
MDEIHRISEIDVSESGDVVYKWVGGVLEAVPEKWQRPRSYGEGWSQRVERVRAGLSQGGVAWGAFHEDRLIAFAALRYRLAGALAALLALLVRAAYRRRGVASQLVQKAVEAARGGGAESVYVSACPSESACGFYRSRGFRPTAFVHRELYEMEPEDIHMTLDL